MGVRNRKRLDSELIWRAFRGRRTALVGDSTVLVLGKVAEDAAAAARRSLGQSWKAESGCCQPDDRPDGVYEAIEPKFLPPEPYNATDGTALSWFGFSGPTTESRTIGSLSQVARFQPDVVYFTFGLHWLHFLGIGRDERECHMRHWLDYEHWLDAATDAFRATGAHTVVVKTVNSICGNYALASHLYGRFDEQTLARCALTAGQGWPTNTSSADYLAEYCLADYRQAWYDERAWGQWGRTSQNQRLLSHLQCDQRIAAIVDESALLSCNYTSQAMDGITIDSTSFASATLLVCFSMCKTKLGMRTLGAKPASVRRGHKPQG